MQQIKADSPHNLGCFYTNKVNLSIFFVRLVINGSGSAAETKRQLVMQNHLLSFSHLSEGNQLRKEKEGL